MGGFPLVALAISPLMPEPALDLSSHLVAFLSCLASLRRRTRAAILLSRPVIDVRADKFGRRVVGSP